MSHHKAARREGESYEDYKARQREDKLELKQFLKGRVRIPMSPSKKAWVAEIKQKIKMIKRGTYYPTQLEQELKIFSHIRPIPNNKKGKK